MDSRFDEWLNLWGCRAAGAVIVTGQARLLPVTRGGAALMLKLIAQGSDEAGSGAVLAALDGRFAVRLVAAQGPALLMERSVPTGPALEQMAIGGLDDAALTVLCDMALGVQGALRGADLPELIPLDRRLQALRTAADPLSLWAQALADEMLTDRADWTALHGDLHHFNVLHSADRGWLTIDPKGVLGPPLYDLANALLNPYPHAALVHSPARMARGAALVARRMGCRADEVLRWVCLHGCLASVWSPGDAFWSIGARIAGRLAGLAPPQEPANIDPWRRSH